MQPKLGTGEPCAGKGVLFSDRIFSQSPNHLMLLLYYLPDQYKQISCMVLLNGGQRPKVLKPLSAI